MLGKWELNEVYCADALTMLQGLPDESVDLVVTSPPYDGLRTYNGYSFDFEPIARESFRVMKQGGVVVWVVGDSSVNGSETLTSFRQALYFVECGYRMHDTMIWDKAKQPGLYGKRYEQVFEYMFILSKGEPSTFNPLMVKSKTAGTKRRASTRKDGYVATEKVVTVNDWKLDANIWYIPTGFGQTSTDGTTGHPAMFPEALAERHIMTWSNPGEVVLDFFGGSGTTAKMARTLNRQWITNDISSEYVALINKRLDRPFTPNMFDLLGGV